MLIFKAQPLAASELKQNLEPLWAFKRCTAASACIPQMCSSSSLRMSRSDPPCDQIWDESPHRREVSFKRQQDLCTGLKEAPSCLKSHIKCARLLATKTCMPKSVAEPDTEIDVSRGPVLTGKAASGSVAEMCLSGTWSPTSLTKAAHLSHGPSRDRWEN